MNRSPGATLARHAKIVAQQWVNEEASALPGFAGACLHGSINWLPEDAFLPPTSDLDVMVVLDAAAPPPKPGKFRYRDVLLEVSYAPRAQFRSAAYILGQYHLAGSFRAASVIADPGGWLREVQQAVARDYAKRPWVRRRCGHARHRILTGFALESGDLFSNQVTAWLFPTGIRCSRPVCETRPCGRGTWRRGRCWWNTASSISTTRLCGSSDARR